MLRAIDISTSGLIAQRQRMNTIAENIANVNTTVDANGNAAPFRRRFVTFSADSDRVADPRGAGVRYRVEVDRTTPLRRVYQPGHPQADADGYVSYPNIKLIDEFVNAMDAGRAYQANIAAIEMTKEMANITMRILA